MNYLARTSIVVVAVCAFLLSTNAEAARKAKDLLQYIPEDTPYVMAFTKPLPDDVMDKFEPAVDKTLSAYQRILRYHMSEQMVELSNQEGGAEQAEQLQSFMDEILGLMSVQGLRDAGMGRDALFAVYGDGLLPVIRIALSNRAKFDAAIERIESKASEALPTATVSGESYRYLDLDEMRVVIATLGNDAVISLVPASVGDERLSQTLGLTKPRKNLAKSKTLKNINKEYGYTDHFMSFIDVERIASVFTGDPSGRNAEFLAVMDHDPSELSAQCQAEFKSLASVAPRIVMGYKAVNKDFLETGMVVELRDDIAAGLATLPAAVPGLGPDLGGLFSFGFSLDPLALRSFYEARLDAMEADPFECEALGELQASTVKGREALAQPVPPVVYSFRGFLANITNIEGMDVATQTPPESIDASILFAIENAQDLVTMAAMMSPEVAALNLIPDGKAKLLDLPQLAEIAEQAFAALSANGLSVSMGEGADANAEAMLTAEVAKSKPLMSAAFDAKRYYEFVGKAMMEEEAAEGGEQIPLAMRVALRDAMVSSGEMYERVAVNVHLTERGVEVNTSMTLAD
ncbi:MAG: hypothetical protein EX272_10410 [Chromatiales bacterium]|nr:MAG: hypothetical protein EX272_10410 [Chromatiales bacterium]